MSLFITADHHFGHFNIIKYCNRPFKTAEEMDEHLIKCWNERVSRNDTVYHLGDFTFNNIYSDIETLRGQLNGTIILIEGNHDSDNVKAIFRSVQILDLKIIGCPPITFCHYPMLTWNKSHYGAWQLFGHHHGTLTGIGTDPTLVIRPHQQMDIGVDTNNFYPYEISEIKQKLEKI